MSFYVNMSSILSVFAIQRSLGTRKFVINFLINTGEISELFIVHAGRSFYDIFGEISEDKSVMT